MHSLSIIALCNVCFCCCYYYCLLWQMATCLFRIFGIFILLHCKSLDYTTICNCNLQLQATVNLCICRYCQYTFINMHIETVAERTHTHTYSHTNTQTSNRTQMKDTSTQVFCNHCIV